MEDTPVETAVVSAILRRAGDKRVIVTLPRLKRRVSFVFRD
jgi:hypothetical protein